MKRSIIYTIVILAFTNLSLASPLTENIKKSITQKRLCKTWYVVQAYKYKANGKKSDNSDKARGSQFIFNKDNTFVLVDLSPRSRKKKKSGDWKIISRDSVSIKIDQLKLRFKVVYLSKDSLYIIANEGGHSSDAIHITFSSDTIKPIKRENSKQEILYEDLEIERPEPIQEDEEASMEIEEEVVEVPNVENHLKKQLCKTWIGYKAYINEKNITDDFSGSSFSFKKDQSFILLERGQKKETSKGAWKITKDMSLSITNEGDTVIFDVTFISENLLVLKSKDGSEYVTFYFKADKKDTNSH